MRSRIGACMATMSFMTLMCGCSNKSNIVYNVEDDKQSLDGYTIPSDYDFTKAESDGFVIYDNNEIINENSLDEFYEKTKQGQQMTLTIVYYTINGDPIITQYVYKDNEYIVYEDNTRDTQVNGTITVKLIKDIELGVNEDNLKIIVEKY